MSLDERLRREFSESHLATVPSDDTVVGVVLDRGRRIRRRRWRRATAVSTAAMLVVGVGAVRLLDGDRATSVVAGSRPSPSGGGAWRSLPDAPIEPRYGHSMIWTGRQVIVWGGASGSDVYSDGAGYDPAADRWHRIARSPLSARTNHAGVWTGKEMVVVGGSDARGHPSRTGAAYKPSTDTWRRIPPVPLAARQLSVSVWTGREVLVVGGLLARGQAALDGAAFDPATNRWRVLPSAPFPPALVPTSQAAWTGVDLVMIEEGPSRLDGPGSLRAAAYTPATNTWRLLPPTPFGFSEDSDGQPGVTRILSPFLLWTGSDVLALLPGTVMPHSGGAAYDPGTSAWSVLPAPGEQDRLPAGPPVWTGLEALLWNGSGVAFDPVTQQWRTLPETDHPRREGQRAVWTGTEMVGWGGWKWRSNGQGLGDGYAYRPPGEEVRAEALARKQFTSMAGAKRSLGCLRSTAGEVQRREAEDARDRGGPVGVANMGPPSTPVWVCRFEGSFLPGSVPFGVKEVHAARYAEVVIPSSGVTCASTPTGVPCTPRGTTSRYGDKLLFPG